MNVAAIALEAELAEAERRARHLDAASTISVRRESFDLPSVGPGANDRCVYLIGNDIGPAPAASGIGTEPAGRAGLVHSMADLVGADPDQILFLPSVEIAADQLLRHHYRRQDPRMRMLAVAGVDAGIRIAEQCLATEVGLEPDKQVAWLYPIWGERRQRPELLMDFLARYGHEYSIVVLDAIDRYTADLHDIAALTDSAHAVGCVVGWDLTGVVGSTPLDLSGWQVDFALWSTRAYLNGGDGNLIGCFLRAPSAELTERSASTLQSWPEAAVARLTASLDVFDEIGISAVYDQSAALTGFLRALLDRSLGEVSGASLVPPSNPARPVTQVSLRVEDGTAAELAAQLRADGVLVHTAAADLLCMAPVALYCTFHDCWRAVGALTRRLTQ